MTDGRGISERVAIVIGAGGELGRSTAQKLAAAGFTVVGVDRNEDALKDLPDGIRYVAGDPTDPAGAKSIVDRIAAEFGSPEVLVNCSTPPRPGRTCPPSCSRTPSHPRRSPTSSSTSSVTPPRRSAARSCPPTAPDRQPRLSYV
jgi:NAD(P)-dependent dehydrogenase (short-subunit alcohol dehydrogenase family)